MSRFDEFLKGLKREVAAFAEAHWKDLKGAAVADGSAALGAPRTGAATASTGGRSRSGMITRAAPEDESLLG